MKVIKVSDEVHARLVEGAEGSIGSYIEELLDKPTTDVYPEYVKDLFSRVDKLVTGLEGTPAGGVSEKENPNPQKSSWLKPVRSKSLVQSELWAAEKKLKNVVQEVQGMSVEESLADEEAERYGEALKEEYRAEIANLQYELSGMEG